MNNVKKTDSTQLAVLEQLVAAIGQVLLGKQTQIKLALTCILASGHLLIEDLPGMGKTTLAHAIADVLGLRYNRVQFTSDLLPTDLLGVSIFNRTEQNFEFHQGPIFTQLLLADEINRTTPKTQSALLEAMEEGQVSIEGATYELPSPFFVIATQNPSHNSGTYPLPESQLDRFMMRIELGYPSREAELCMLRSVSNHVGARNRSNSSRAKLSALISLDQLESLQNNAASVVVSDHLLDYLQRLIQFSREDSAFKFGISPRGSMALLCAAKAWAFLENRNYLLPEDVQQVFVAVIGHRLVGAASDQATGTLAEYILARVDVLYE